MERIPRPSSESDKMPALQEVLGAVARHVDFRSSRNRPRFHDFAVSTDKEQRLLQSPWFATVRIAFNIPMPAHDRRLELAQALAKTLSGRGAMVGIEPNYLVTRFAVANGSQLAHELAHDFAETAQNALQGHEPQITVADVISYRPSSLLRELEIDPESHSAAHGDAGAPIDLQP